jgi:putative RNA 2'-phosphotransferase
VDLQLKPKRPPEQLYHGTARKNVNTILEEGLTSQNRNFVHLSATRAEAKKVGSRHGNPAILEVESLAMYEEEITYYQSESDADIWLTKVVFPEFLSTNS